MTRRRAKLEPAIRFVPIDELWIIAISEEELETLERGSLESIFLNLAIFVLSVAVSFTISLATTRIDDAHTFIVFVIVATAGWISGITFLLLWFQSRRSLRSVSARIRSRIPPAGFQEDTEADEAGRLPPG